MMRGEFELQPPGISDHCFTTPLGEHDFFHQTRTAFGNFDLNCLRVQAEEKARESAARWKDIIGPFRSRSPGVTRERLTSKIFGLLTSSRYRRGNIDYVRIAEEDILSRIGDAIARDEPIEILLEFFAFKMRNGLRTFSLDGTEVDLSEAAAVLRFHEIASAVKELYPPGAVVKVATDGTKFCAALETTPETARAYAANVGVLARMLGAHNTVKFFDEEDFFADDYLATTDVWYAQLKEEYYASSNPELAETVFRLRNSMHFMLPMATDIPIDVVSLAFSKQICDDQLKIKSRDSYHLRKDVQERALVATLKYIAVKKATPQALRRVAPEAILCCAHPRPGYLGLYIAGRGNTLFPHHSQGVSKSCVTNSRIDDIRMGYAADIRRDPRSDNGLIGLVLPSAIYKFSNDVHPFTFVSSSPSA